ncbi:hypothetical protein DL769_001970 [Monosporascus sp. CRB-8-3]|nr:hypothetical protein DL769_001970 [Monosporascus sp. CRB-8-3]
MPGEATKSQVLRSLDEAAYAFKRTIKSCDAIQDVAGLPEAFPVVAKRLSVLVALLESMKTYLETGQETQEIKEKYTAVYQLAEVSRKQAGYLQDLFVAVTAANDAVPKLERYRKAVADGDGTRIESVLKDLLERAVNVAVAPLVGDDLIKELQEALEEVAALKPSLKEDPKGAVTLNNYSEGSQFYHGGKGNQNHCSGGIQITGDSATNNITSDNKSRPAN